MFRVDFFIKMALPTKGNELHLLCTFLLSDCSSVYGMLTIHMHLRNLLFSILPEPEDASPSQGLQ